MHAERAADYTVDSKTKLKHVIACTLRTAYAPKLVPVMISMIDIMIYKIRICIMHISYAYVHNIDMNTGR